MRLTTIGLILALSAPVWSDVIYTNLGPGDTYDTGSVYYVDKYGYVATSFVPSTTGNLTSISLPLDETVSEGEGFAKTFRRALGPSRMSRPSHTPNFKLQAAGDLVITLRAPGPDPTGTILETWVLTQAQATAPPPIKVLTSVLHPTLQAGTAYWLRLDSDTSSVSYLWFLNSTGSLGVALSFDQGATWNGFPDASPAFQVNADIGTTFQVRYFANLNIGDSLINIVNTGANGASLNGPGFGPVGNICANVYAFSPDEQLVSCCSCLVTPNGLVSLSVHDDLRSNTLTGVAPNSMVVKLLATATGAGPAFTGSTCAGSAAAAGTAAFPLVVAGAAAWGTTTHTPAFFVPPGQPIPLLQAPITETPFTRSTLSAGERASIVNRCANIIGNGSGYGICGACSPGGRSASRQ